jgi:hypothetical protein
LKLTSPAFTPPSAQELLKPPAVRALSNLLNAIGDTLKPKITAFIHPANNGAGIPEVARNCTLGGYQVFMKWHSYR